MAIYIARKDKLVGGYNGNLEHVIVHNATEAVAVPNGHFVTVAGLMAGERETKKATLAGTADILKDVLFIHNSEVMYDERLYKKADYIKEAGKVSRAYRLYDGDIVTLTLDCFADAPAVGDVFVVKSAGKLGKNATPTTPAKVYFDVIEDSGYELHAEQKAFAVQVRRG